MQLNTHLNKLNFGIRRSVFAIFSALDLSDQEVLDLLELSDREFTKIRNGLNFQLETLELLCSKLNITLDHLSKNSIDYIALAQQFSGACFAFPEKYCDPQGKLARTRTVLGVYSYLQAGHGFRYANGILRKLQLHPSLFSSPDDMVSSFLIQDLLDEMSKSRFTDKALIEMGKNAVNINKNTNIGKLLCPSKSPKELYERVHAEVLGAHYDMIFNYHLANANDEGVKMITTIKTDAQEALKTKVFGNRQLCLYKQGVYASFLGHISKSNYNLVESECLYLGGTQCVFHVTW